MRIKVVRTLALASARAGATKGGTARQRQRDGPRSRLELVLGLAGIQPATTPSVNVNIEVRAGYVVDLPDHPPQPAPRTIPGD